MTQSLPFLLPMHHGCIRLLHGVGSVLLAMICEIVALQRLARERAHLAELDQVRLQDIGLTPLDVTAELEKPLWRR